MGLFTKIYFFFILCHVCNSFVPCGKTYEWCFAPTFSCYKKDFKVRTQVCEVDTFSKDCGEVREFTSNERGFEHVANTFNCGSDCYDDVWDVEFLLQHTCTKDGSWSKWESSKVCDINYYDGMPKRTYIKQRLGTIPVYFNDHYHYYNEYFNRTVSDAGSCRWHTTEA